MCLYDSLPPGVLGRHLSCFPVMLAAPATGPLCASPRYARPPSAAFHLCSSCPCSLCVPAASSSRLAGAFVVSVLGHLCGRTQSGTMVRFFLFGSMLVRVLLLSCVVRSRGLLTINGLPSDSVHLYRNSSAAATKATTRSSSAGLLRPPTLPPPFSPS